METRRKILRIVGLVLIAAALGAIGYSAYNLLSTEIDTQASLEEAEQLIREMEAEMVEPQDNLAPEPDVTPDASGLLPGETMSPDDPGDPGDALAPGDSDGTAGQDDPSGADGSGTKKPTGTGGTKKSSAVGILIFDSLGGRKVAVLEGATPRQLSRGAAHDSHTSKPGAVGNCVIFGHRNTVFRGFGKLKNGDTIQLKVPGKTYTYKINSMAVVDPDDGRIYKAYGQPVMTLVTCYPFNYVGSAPQRYIVVAVLQ